MREEATGGRHHLTVNEAKSVLPGTDGERFAKVLEYGTM